MSDGVGRAYDARAAEYIELAGDVARLADADRQEIGRWADATTGRILDAGCGPGLWTGFLHAAGRDVLGIDLSEQFVAHARAQHPELEFVHGSFEELPAPDASLGGILAWYSLIHTPPEQLPAVLAEFARVLAPGAGILIGFFEGAPREPFAHAITTAYFWTPDAMADLLVEAGFTVTASESRPRIPGEVSSRLHASVTAVRV
ncbi:ubiquinone/menaquinone biosynthesis C-methylase UbiE [Microbacterium sp. W4I4]|uniref:class I SAM-dependent methyltransferase n=1 Tax=Microbacterium sp. W4I4 TaxID=3042295 RepID=UPI00277DB688|nr:class I SAM-dependent methyltransferase [Microbacterium sp. W4I4]MDQ0615831.1 ubiquinone/menaquinone biosynthesis C-methylase UbiE [Microbacterium sp. W4I4]